MVSFSQRVLSARLKKKLTIEEVAKATKIRPQFITAIEKGDYDTLPSGTYSYGFVHTYIEYLGLPVRELMALFRREFKERDYMRLLPESFAAQEKPLQRFKFSQAMMWTVVVIVVLAIYLLFQYRGAFLAPSLTVFSPKEKNITQGQVVIVQGKTDPNTMVTINDEPAFVDSDGSFRKNVMVFERASKIVIKAENKFGKRSVIEQVIEVK